MTAITIYSTPWCGYCTSLKRAMTREGIAFTDIDITDDPQAVAFVEGVNGGNQTVPTVVFEDGTALTNPSLSEVRKRVSA